MPTTPTMRAWFEDYESYHQNPKNKLTHYIGVPAIMVTLLGLLALVEIGPIDLGFALWIVSALWYLKLDWRIGVPFSAVALGAYFVGTQMSVFWLWTLFILGWVLQLYGHIVYEKKSPALVKNIRQTVIAPIWIFAKAIGYHN